MKILVLLTAPILFCLFSGCCRPWDEPQPERPNSVVGWQSYRMGTVRVLGVFVLNEGQSTESDSLGIQVVKISPLLTCLGRLEDPTRKSVILKIYRPADKTILCQATLGEGSGALQCPNGSQLPSVSVNGINTKERWVTFGLGETAPE